MDSSSIINIPISAIQAYHSEERQLYSRMVLNLGMDPTRSMEIIAFWIWLEEKGHADAIHRMNSFNDPILLAVASLGQTFIEALHLDLPPDHPSHSFRQEALHGIGYYLNSVCLKALDDIRRKAEEEANIRRMEMLVRQMSRTYLDCINTHGGSRKIPGPRDPFGFPDSGPAAGMRPHGGQPFVPHGEGTSRGVGGRKGNTPSAMDVEWAIQSGYPFNMSVPMLGAALDFSGGHLNPGMAFGNHHQVRVESPAPPHYFVGPDMHVNSSRRLRSGPPQQNIPRDERTLFVTFSNGYPFTEEELYCFFMRHYGDVELVTVQKPKGNKPPLFAHVSFHSLATVFRILNGNGRVKFMTKGKHLWARRFIPKRNQEYEDE